MYESPDAIYQLNGINAEWSNSFCILCTYSRHRIVYFINVQISGTLHYISFAGFRIMCQTTKGGYPIVEEHTEGYRMDFVRDEGERQGNGRG